MKNITIKDVAKALNLSIATVSRAFNNKYDIRQETRERILTKAREMGYCPNPIAQGFAVSKSYLIGVIVPEFINAYFPSVIMGIQKELSKYGYQILIMSSDESAAQELENIKALEKNRVDGIIISLTHETKDITYFQKIMERNIPIVQFNRADKRLKTPKIVIDDAMLAEKATEHLIEQGYKKIYHLSGPSNMSISHNRSNGFRNAMKKHNLTCGARNIIDSGIFIEDGKTIAEALIKKGDIPDAFFCFNDPVAIGAIETFKEHKYEIPKDVAFVGFTESPIAIYMSPRLTTVKQPTEEIGTKAALSLLRIIQEGKKETDETITCYGIINIRESSIKA